MDPAGGMPTEYAGWLLGEIRRHLPFPAADVDGWILPPVGRFAAFVFDLPASERREGRPDAAHHALPFGLLQHSLEAAYWALRLPLTRYRPFKGLDLAALRLLFFYGALLHDVGKVRHVGVVDRVDRTLVWDPDAEALAEFASRVPDRLVLWDPARSFVRDTAHTAGIVDAFVPPEAAGRIARELPIGGLADIFLHHGDEAYAFDHRVGRLLRACDRNSQVDEIQGRNLRELTHFVDRCRRADAEIAAALPQLEAPPADDPIACELVGALLSDLVARRVAAVGARQLVEDFQTIVNCRGYQLFVNTDNGTSQELRWGYFLPRPNRASGARGRVRVRTRADFDPTLARRRGKLARHLPAFLAAESARRRHARLGAAASRALQQARSFLRPLAPGAPALPAALADHLDAFVRRYGACPDLFELAAAALAFSRRVRADLAAARPTLDEVQALLGRRDLVGPLGRAVRILRRTYAVRVARGDEDPARPAAPGLLLSGRTRIERTASAPYLRTLGLPRRSAEAFARAVRAIEPHRRRLARHERLFDAIVGAARALGRSQPPPETADALEGEVGLSVAFGRSLAS